MIKIHPSKVSWDYLAGMVDADGCISILKRVSRSSNPVYNVRLTVSNNCLSLMEDLKSQFGGFVGRVDKNNRCWRWILSGTYTKPILSSIYDELRIKGGQALVCLRLLDLVDEQGSCDNHRRRLSEWEVIARDELYLECRTLNSNGRGKE